MSIPVTLSHVRECTKEEAKIYPKEVYYRMRRNKWARKKHRVYFRKDGKTTYWVPCYPNT
jgi:hypothetical protein